MNKKVWITLLALLISALVAYNIVAFFFPEQFIMCLTNTGILKFGEFIESSPYIYWIYSIVLTFTLYYLWSVVANKTFKLKLYQYGIIAILVAITYLVQEFIPAMTLVNNIIMMLAIYFFSKQENKFYILFFAIYMYSQYMILFVRGYEAALPLMNTGSELCLFMENLVLCLVFAIISIYKKRRIKNECESSTNN